MFIILLHFCKKYIVFIYYYNKLNETENFAFFYLLVSVNYYFIQLMKNICYG